MLKLWWHGRRWAYVADGNRVIVGNFGDDGLYVGYYWADGRRGNIGVASSRNSGLCGKALH